MNCTEHILIPVFFEEADMVFERTAYRCLICGEEVPAYPVRKMPAREQELAVAA